MTSEVISPLLVHLCCWLVVILHIRPSSDPGLVCTHLPLRRWPLCGLQPQWTHVFHFHTVQHLSYSCWPALVLKNSRFSLKSQIHSVKLAFSKIKLAAFEWRMDHTPIYIRVDRSPTLGSVCIVLPLSANERPWHVDLGLTSVTDCDGLYSPYRICQCLVLPWKVFQNVCALVLASLFVGEPSCIIRW